MITDYTTLIAAVKRWGHRYDTNDVIPDFIALAEADMSRKLRTVWQETALQETSIVDGVIPQPADFAAIRQLWSTAEPRTELYAKPIDVVVALRETSEAPQFHCLRGDQIEFSCNTGTVDGTYFARIPALSNDAPTNWLLTQAPDLYLKAALRHAWEFAGNTARALQCEAQAQRLIAELQAVSDMNKFSGQLAFTPGGP